ncbi:MAG: polymer-forming cytoskeletal protein [Anaerolineales bacterium]
MTSLRSGFRIVWILGPLLFTGAVFQPGTNGVLFRESFTVSARQTYSGDLIAVESSITIEQGATFEGNLILLGGSLESAGNINGDIASLDASTHFGPTATMNGTIACMGPEPALDPGAKLAGFVQTFEGFSWPLSLTAGAASKQETGGLDIWYEVSIILFRLFLLSAVAILIVLFLPAPVERVARTMMVKPAIAFLIGLLTLMAAMAFFLLLALTVCLSPIAILGSIVVLVAALLGWVAMGLEIGRPVSGMLGLKVHPAVMAGIGTAMLTLVASALGYIPFAGQILVLLVIAFGLGAVVLTRFGGPNYLILEKTVSLENNRQS